MMRQQLFALCNVIMCLDLSRLSAQDCDALRTLVDEESRNHGFDSWIEAFHADPQHANAQDVRAPSVGPA